MLTERQNEILTAYANLMQEMRGRLSWIAYMVNGRSGLDPAIARESCHLQIRLICELIALSCLVIHGDIEAAQAAKFQKQWSAPDLLKGLEQLHPHFYPMPQAPPESTGPGSWHFADFEGDYLTQEKLLLLYGQCGNSLHRGSLKNILSGKQTLSAEMADVIAAFKAIQGLLNIHRISLLTEKGQFVCMMNDGEGKVKTLLAFVPDGEDYVDGNQ